VVPLFVVDPALAVPPNRAPFLAESVAVLREELRELGGDLVIREGDPVAETIRLATGARAGTVFVAADVSRYAARRAARTAALPRSAGRPGGLRRRQGLPGAAATPA
jgi:deoxyribodipyrimidine photo-lyase